MKTDGARDSRGKVVAVIPARMGSSRFFGKPLAPILGRPMIEHVYRRTRMCDVLDEVYVATCDAEIRTVAEGFGAAAVMTSDKHQRASDRVAEVALSMPDVDIFVLVQGDEPMVRPEMVEIALGPLLRDPSVVCANLSARIRSPEEFEDRNTIKVVVDRRGDALYFSREPIPTRHRCSLEELPVAKQVCIIPFRRQFLLDFAALEPTPLEIVESIDMLRALEHGYAIRMVESAYLTYSVDTPQDLVRVEAMMRDDPLAKRY